MNRPSWSIPARAILVLFPLCMVGRFASGGDLPKDGAAKQLYVTYCQACHGTTGHGDGAAGAALTPKPRDFTSAKDFKSKSDDELFLLISKGGAAMKMSPAMPPWGSTLKKDQIRQLVTYVRGFATRDSIARGLTTAKK